jgi:hypothetical protein
MRVFIFILFSLLSNVIYGQSPLCASRPTTFCCEYVSSVTINGKTFTGSNGFSSSSGGSPAGYYDYAYTFHIPQLPMVTIWNISSYGLISMVMVF